MTTKAQLTETAERLGVVIEDTRNAFGREIGADAPKGFIFDGATTHWVNLWDGMPGQKIGPKNWAWMIDEISVITQCTDPACEHCQD